MTRSKYFKRRYIRAVFMIWIKEWLFNTTVAVVLVATAVLTWQVINPPTRFSPSPEMVSALRVPPQAMSNLYVLSQLYDIPFDQLLAIYAVTNNFFPLGSSPTVELEVLKEDYVTGFRQLRRQYASRDIRPYFDLFQNLISELEYFPVPQEYSYMFSDTWDQPKGTNILDQENIRGRIPVLSMTEGYVRQAGWHSRLGYHAVIVTERGSRILYAHLNSLEEEISPGRQISAGQVLGSMGSSGEALPVHLHIGVSPSVSFAEDFWINPYPFLKHLQEVNARVF